MMKEKLMLLSDKKLSKNAKDIRLTATSKIWSLAVPMLAICIPLSAVTKSGPLLPLAVIAGTTVGTVSVWRGSIEELTGDSQKSQKIKQLEDRIADLETIITSEEINWEHSLEPSSTSSILRKIESRLEETEQRG